MTAVKLKDQSGEEIGKVIEWMMDVEQGKVVYVVVQFGEDHPYYAIPWGFMRADLDKGGYLVDAQQVKGYDQQVDRALMNDLVTDKEFIDRLYDTYQLPKYWQESQTTAAQPSEATPDAGSAGEGKGYGG